MWTLTTNTILLMTTPLAIMSLVLKVALAEIFFRLLILVNLLSFSWKNSKRSCLMSYISQIILHSCMLLLFLDQVIYNFHMELRIIQVLLPIDLHHPLGDILDSVLLLDALPNLLYFPVVHILLMTILIILFSMYNMIYSTVLHNSPYF